MKDNLLVHRLDHNKPGFSSLQCYSGARTWVHDMHPYGSFLMFHKFHLHCMEYESWSHSAQLPQVSLHYHSLRSTALWFCSDKNTLIHGTDLYESSSCQFWLTHFSLWSGPLYCLAVWLPPHPPDLVTQDSSSTIINESFLKWLTIKETLAYATIRVPISLPSLSHGSLQAVLHCTL